jgi:hypothetical protein
MSNDGLKPSCWGPTAWHFLHSVAMGYPESISNSPKDQAIAQKYKQFFESLEYILPCEWCKVHFKQNIVSLPIDGYLDSRRNLSFWLYKFHNLVNDATSVPDSDRPSFESVYNKYDSLRVPCDQDAKTCGGVGDSKCKMVIQNANQKSESSDNVFKNYWPLIFIIVIILFTIVLLCTKKSKKSK